MLGSLILYLKGMRIVMFQLSGFYYRSSIRRIPRVFLTLRGFTIEGSQDGIGNY